jgi:hypothetical protein
MNLPIVVVGSSGEQLHGGTLVVAGCAHHGLADALFLVRLDMGELEAQIVAVERDRLVEVGHGDPDVINRDHEWLEGVVHLSEDTAGIPVGRRLLCG